MPQKKILTADEMREPRPTPIDHLKDAYTYPTDALMAGGAVVDKLGQMGVRGLMEGAKAASQIGSSVDVSPYRHEGFRMKDQQRRAEDALHMARPLPSVAAEDLYEQYPEGLPQDHPMQKPRAFDKMRNNYATFDWIKRLLKPVERE